MGSPSYPNPKCPGFETLADAATRVGALAVMNAVWWDLCTGNSLGYMYNGAQMPAFPYCYGGTPRPPDTSTNNCVDGPTYMAEGLPWNHPVLLGTNKQPMLTVTGQSQQQFAIVETDANFLDTTSSWTRTSPTTAIWDPNHDGISDVSYAIQMSNPPLVLNNALIGYGNFNLTVPGDYDYVFARTAVGVKSLVGGGTALYLVIADGEGIHGGHGATANQMAHFFKDVLGAQNAFALDSGLSTEMVIQGIRQTTPRRVNTLAGEDAAIQRVPGLQFLDETPTVFGAVANYIKIIFAPPVIKP